MKFCDVCDLYENRRQAATKRNMKSSTATVKNLNSNLCEHQLQLQQQQQVQQQQQRCSSVGSTGSSTCDTLSSLSGSAVSPNNISNSSSSSSSNNITTATSNSNKTIAAASNTLLAPELTTAVYGTTGGAVRNAGAVASAAGYHGAAAMANLALESFTMLQHQAHHFRDMLYAAQLLGRGYYQPAGPLISPHVLPPVAAPPPPNVPLLPTAAAAAATNPNKKQIPPPLSSDPDHLQQPPQSASTADSTDSDVLITGGDLAPFRYPTQGGATAAASAGQQQSAAAHHQHQQQQHQHQQQQQQQQQHQLHQQAAAAAISAAAAAAAAHQGSPYPRSMHAAQMHYSTAYPPNYYTPYPGEAMCYSPPYQPYFSTKVYQTAPPPPRYPYYQPGPPPPHPSAADFTGVDRINGGQQAGPPPPPPTGTQLVPAGPAAHTQHLEHYPGPPGYYAGYSPGGSQCYTRSIQAPYMEYPPQCPCPMQQSCPKNVLTGPHIGSNSGSSNNSSNSSHSSSNIISNNSNKITNNSTNSSSNNHNSNLTLSHSNSNMITNGNKHSKSNSSTLTLSNNQQQTVNSNSSSLAMDVNNSIVKSSSNCSNNNNNKNALHTSRGPVKNLNTVAAAQDASNAMEQQQHLLHQQQQLQLQQCGIDLLQTVKAELKSEDSDNKSQYEENVVQPLTPPESFGTNDEKLLDEGTTPPPPPASTILTTTTTIPLDEDIEDAIDKIAVVVSNNNNNKKTQLATSTPAVASQNNSQISNILPATVEAYDLTLATSPLPQNNNNIPLVGRKARIGKTMAREMVYAGAVANAQQQQQQQQQQHIATLSSTIAPFAAPHFPQHSTTSQQQQQSHVVSNNSGVINNNTYERNNLLPKTQTPFVLKSEIKTEKIKIEDEHMLQFELQQQSELVTTALELKNIKAEPISSPEIINNDGLVAMDVALLLTANNVANGDAARLRLLPRPGLQTPLEQPINCDVELISADDILDLCHSPVSTGTCSSSQKRIKILEFNKNQCKKSPPNSYKSLIKQAEPKSYLCLSRKFDKRHHRYGRLQGKSAKQGNSSGVRRRQLILTDQQKKRLQLRKKKLLALERRKQEAREKRRATAKQKRLEQQQLKVAQAAEAAARLSAVNVDDEIVDLDADDFDEEEEEEKIAVTLIGTSAKSNQLIAGGSGNTPKSSPKHLPKKKYVLPTHLLETIDAVARGYFSEPEAPRCTIYGSSSSSSGINGSTSTACVTPTTQVGRKYKKTKTSEARSKSETKKPLKLSTLAVPSSNTTEQKEAATVTVTPIVAAEFATAARAQKTTSIQLERESAKVEVSEALNDVEHEIFERENEEMTTTTWKQTKNKTKKEIGNTTTATATKIANRKRNSKKGKKRSKTTTKSKTKSNRKSVMGTTTTTATAITSLHHITQTKISAAAEKVLEQAGEDEEEEEATLQSIITAKIAADNTKTSDKMSNISAAEEKLPLLETNNNEYEKSTTTTTATTTPTADHVLLPQAAILQHQQQQPQKTHSEFMFLPPAPPVPRIVCHPHHPTKRTRSRSKFGCRKRQKLKHSVSYEVDETLPPMTRSSDVVPKWNNGWTWEGEAFQGAVFLNSDDPLVIRTCYPAMRHSEGDIIRTRDCVLLKANEDNELPYVAKVAHLWENPEDGEMMMSLLWYYRPEHTEQGRQENDSSDEVYASRHRDHNSVACIEDKCYVLTFSEYCRYRRRLRAAEEDIEDVSMVPKRPNFYSLRIVPENTNPELVMFCRRAYEFRTKRLLKMPNKQDYYVVTS